MSSKIYFNEKSIQILDKVLEQQNDTYYKYKLNCLVEAIIIENTTVEKSKFNNLKMETYIDYKKLNVNTLNKEWIYNIIDHKSESENILSETDNLIIIPDYKWTKNLDDLHILCIFKDKSLFSVRELTNIHIPLLEEAIKIGSQTIKEKYGINQDSLIMYFHYHPSVWQLHLHYMRFDSKSHSFSLPRAHSINSVIQNLKLDTDYYKKVELEIQS
jgi:m7GpppX diphosphatase